MEEEEHQESFRSSVETLTSQPEQNHTIDHTVEDFDLLVATAASRYESISSFRPSGKSFYLPDLVQLELKALATGKMKDAIAVWSVPLYAQRKYWFKLFIGFNYGIFSTFLMNWTIRGIPDPTFGEPTLRIYEYLAKNAGINLPEDVRLYAFLSTKNGVKDMEKAFKKFNTDAPEKHAKTKSTESVPVKRLDVKSIRSNSPHQTFRSKLPLDGLKLKIRRSSSNSDNSNLSSAVDEEPQLTDPSRQSKLSQEQLSELQRSTHFDKKELQQWYKGREISLLANSCTFT
jgi:hypothetical protein